MRIHSSTITQKQNQLNGTIIQEILLKTNLFNHNNEWYQYIPYLHFVDYPFCHLFLNIVDGIFRQAKIQLILLILLLFVFCNFLALIGILLLLPLLVLLCGSILL